MEHIFWEIFSPHTPEKRVCLGIMENTLTFTDRAQASLTRARRAKTREGKFHQLHIAEAQLQFAERYERKTFAQAFDVSVIRSDFTRQLAALAS